MSNSERLGFAILDHLSGYMTSGEVSGDLAETLEVAIQCLEQVFKVESYDAKQKEALKVNQSLQEIFDATVATIKPPETSGDPTVMQPTAGDRGKAEELKAEGNQLMKIEKYHEAITCYTQAIDLDNTNPVYPCNRAAAYSKISEHQKAIEDCLRALKLDPKYSKAYGRMGLSYQSLHDLVKAKESYHKAIELEPENVFYIRNLQQVENSLGQGAAGGTMGGAASGPNAAGMPNLGGLDFASLLSNPAVMNMAQSFMQNPQMQQMVSSMMTGGAPAQGGAAGGGVGGGVGGGGGGGMNQLFQVAQNFGEQLQQSNPDLMHELRTQAQETFDVRPTNDSTAPSEKDNLPDEKGDGSGHD